MDIEELFGADKKGVSVEKLTLYLPNKDRHDVEYPDYETWVETAATLLAYVNWGSTRMAPAGGKWFEDMKLTSEHTTLIYSFVNQKRFERDAEAIARFVHTFGHRTDQSTVLVEMSGEVLEGEATIPQYRCRSYEITSFKKAESDDIPLDRLLDHLLPDP